jgi:hypothetical protein
MPLILRKWIMSFLCTWIGDRAWRGGASDRDTGRTEGETARETEGTDLGTEAGAGRDERDDTGTFKGEEITRGGTKEEEGEEEEKALWRVV